MNSELKFWLALNAIPGLGARRAKLLLEEFKTPRDILEASSGRLRSIPGIGGKLVERIKAWEKYLDIEKEFFLMEKHQVQALVPADSSYPENLSKIFDPPIVLYVKGKLLPRDKVAIAVIGSRRPSLYGMKMAEKLSRELSQYQITIVSGLARGIDSSAHRGTLKSGGRTIAVLGSGLDRVYPPENKTLAKEISENGAVVSEFPMSTKPERGNFPRRNRIISGLSLGVAVVEAAERSGSLITVDSALEQGREVFALPGKVDSPTSRGTNKLIQQGAKLLSNSRDIIEELGGICVEKEASPQDECPPKGPVLSLGREEEKIYALLSQEPYHLDFFIQKSKLSASSVMSLLLNLQMKQLAKELPGKVYIKG